MVAESTFGGIDLMGTDTEIEQNAAHSPSCSGVGAPLQMRGRRPGEGGKRALEKDHPSAVRSESAARLVHSRRITIARQQLPRWSQRLENGLAVPSTSGRYIDIKAVVVYHQITHDLCCKYRDVIWHVSHLYRSHLVTQPSQRQGFGHLLQ